MYTLLRTYVYTRPISVAFFSVPICLILMMIIYNNAAPPLHHATSLMAINTFVKWPHKIQKDQAKHH